MKIAPLNMNFKSTFEFKLKEKPAPQQEESLIKALQYDKDGNDNYYAILENGYRGIYIINADNDNDKKVNYYLSRADVDYKIGTTAKKNKNCECC